MFCPAKGKRPWPSSKESTTQCGTVFPILLLGNRRITWERNFSALLGFPVGSFIASYQNRKTYLSAGISMRSITAF
jgi:hypothetical protein